MKLIKNSTTDENWPSTTSTSLRNFRVILLNVNGNNNKNFHHLIFADLEVVVGSDCTDSLYDTKESSDNDSYTAPLSPKVRVTNI